MNNDSNNLNNNLEPVIEDLNDPAPVNNPSVDNVSVVTPTVNTVPENQPVAPVINNTVASTESIPATNVTAPNPASAPIVNNPTPPVSEVSPQPALTQPVSPQPVASQPISPSINQPVAQEVPVQSQLVIESLPENTDMSSTPVENAENESAKKELKRAETKKMIIYGVIIVILIGVLIYVLTKNNSPSAPSVTPPPEINTTTPTPVPVPTDAVLLNDVKIMGHQCIDTKCSVSIGDADNPVEYALNISNVDYFNSLNDYEDYIVLNVYYVEKDQNRSIVDYKVFLKSNNEDVTSIKTEDALRTKLGLFSLGSHTESLTLSTIGSDGVGSDDSGNYTYRTFMFKDSNNNEYEMKLKNPSSTLSLVEGNQYSVTFEVVKGAFEYEYNITSIK